MYEDNLAYAKGRLENSLVRTVGGVPVFIEQISGDGICTGSTLNGMPMALKLRELNVLPVPLGYINFENTAVYTCRKPARKWKQGLTSDNLYFVGGGNKIREAWPFPSLEKTINNVYPSVDVAAKVAKKNQSYCAFHRDFAVSSGQQLCYKGVVVGDINGKDVTLSRQYEYLVEYLEEVLA